MTWPRFLASAGLLTACLSLHVGLADGAVPIVSSVCGESNAPLPTLDSHGDKTLRKNSPPRIVSGSIAFTKQVIAEDVDETHSVVAADLDGDGDLDVAATDYIDGLVLWYENDGNGGFVARVLDADLEGAYPSHVADVDSDGDTDVLACGYLADAVVWYENDGSAVFTRHVVDATADGAHSVVTADLDRDSDIDLLTTNQDGGSVTWYENDGNQNFLPHLIDAAAAGAKRAEFADVDDDGDLDVIAGSYDVDEIAWHENDGSQSFTKHVIDAASDGVYYVDPADVDGDGDVDVLSASRLADTIAWYENDGSGGFAKRAIDTGTDGARTVIAMDLDLDGDPDALTCSVNINTVGWYENDGNGGFTRRAIDVDAGGAYGVFAVDMDRDGDIDVLSASRDDGIVALHHQIKEHHAYLPNQGGTLVIDDGHLLASDPDDGPAELKYTITEGPIEGELRVGGAIVTTGGAFTQDDVDNDRLSYVHDGSVSFADRFRFTVADGGEDGFKPAGGTFAIRISDPILAHWPLDEASGPVASDVAGGYDGTLSGGPVWLPDGGRTGGALQFDGIDDTVDIGTIDIAGGSGMTVALWLRPQAFNGDSRLISKATGTAEADHIWMVSTFDETALRFRLRAGGVTSTLITGQNELQFGVWYHVACTYDETQMRIYGNGMLLASMPKTGALEAAPAVTAAIGNQPAGAGSHPFAGSIDDVRLYRSALSETEIAELANIAMGVSDEGGDSEEIAAEPIPDRHALFANVPNPFNPSTAIRYELSRATEVTIQVFDLRGRRVRTLVDGPQAAGAKSIAWDGCQESGVPVATGVYLVVLSTPDFVESIKVTLVE